MAKTEVAEGGSLLVLQLVASFEHQDSWWLPCCGFAGGIIVWLEYSC
jgi:hypothetical protein